MCELATFHKATLRVAHPTLERLSKLPVRDRRQEFGIKVFEVECAEGGRFPNNFDGISWADFF